MKNYIIHLYKKKGEVEITSKLTKELKGKGGRLYYLKFSYINKEIYKIGYTSRNIEERMKTLGIPGFVRTEILQIVHFDNAIDAFTIEQLLHKEFERDKFIGSRLLENGNSELYKRDILKDLIKEKEIRINRKDLENGIGFTASFARKSKGY